MCICKTGRRSHRTFPELLDHLITDTLSPSSSHVWLCCAFKSRSYACHSLLLHSGRPSVSPWLCSRSTCCHPPTCPALTSPRSTLAQGLASLGNCICSSQLWTTALLNFLFHLCTTSSYLGFQKRLPSLKCFHVRYHIPSSWLLNFEQSSNDSCFGDDNTEARQGARICLKSQAWQNLEQPVNFWLCFQALSVTFVLCSQWSFCGYVSYLPKC